MGDEGRLIEILSAEDQELAVELMKATEATFSIETDLAYWWSGLKDEDDDGQWVWAGSKDRIFKWLDKTCSQQGQADDMYIAFKSCLLYDPAS